MIKDLFNEFLKLSQELRPGYPFSLGMGQEIAQESIQEVFKKIKINIPTVYEVIYGTVQGTKRNIEDQRMFDFTPGYRLIHIDEFIHEKNVMNKVLENENQYKFVLPLLTNLSSDFICFAEKMNGEQHICTLLHEDGELVLMHQTVIKFFETINEFYKHRVYSLDKDNFLDYDWEKESSLGARINPNVGYWCS